MKEEPELHFDLINYSDEKLELLLEQDLANLVSVQAVKGGLNNDNRNVINILHFSLFIYKNQKWLGFSKGEKWR